MLILCRKLTGFIRTFFGCKCQKLNSTWLKPQRKWVGVSSTKPPEVRLSLCVTEARYVNLLLSSSFSLTFLSFGCIS